MNLTFGNLADQNMDRLSILPLENMTFLNLFLKVILMFPAWTLACVLLMMLLMVFP